MDEITPEMQQLARQELARRELERRQSLKASEENMAEKETSIPEDILQSIKNSPHALGGMLSSLPGEINAAAHQPLGRSLKNIGQGVENLATLPLDLGSELVNYLAKKHVPYMEELKKVYPKIPEHDLFGLGEKEPGDTLWQSAIPFGGLGKLTKGIGGLKGTAARAGGGALYSAAQGENPIESFLTGSALEGLTHGATALPRKIGNLAERINTGASNLILNRARKGIETGESFTPEQALRNSTEQYTNIEGKPMGADFGTLIGNKMIQGIYNTTSKVPFSGGRQQIAKVDKELFDKKEQLAKIEHEQEQGELSKEQQGYKTKLRQSVDILQKEKDFLEHELPKIDEQINNFTNNYNEQKSVIEQAPEILNSMRHPSIGHNQLFKDEITSGFENAKTESEAAYMPFKTLDVDLNAMRMPSEFKSKYREAYDELKKQSEDLKELFADDKDLGNDISKEIKRADYFFEEKPETQQEKISQPRIGNYPLFDLKHATTDAISTHIKNLQSLAEEAYSSGKHRQAAQLNKMARGMKSDMKKILSENGYEDAVESLEEGDRIFRETVLPYYKNREIKKLASDRNYHLSDTTRSTLANNLHQPGMENILNTMSPDANKALIYELITKGKYGINGHNLTPEKIATAFHTHAKSNVRETIANTNPEISNYLENLNPMIQHSKNALNNIEKMHAERSNILKRKTKSIGKGEAQKEIAEKGQKEIEEKRKKSTERFEEAMKERFGKPKIKSSNIIKYLRGAGVGTGIYFASKIPSLKLLLSSGLAIKGSRALNKILTETEGDIPKLLKHFTEGTKVKSNIKNQGKLEEKIKKHLKVPMNLPLSNKKRKPLEIEIRK